MKLTGKGETGWEILIENIWVEKTNEVDEGHGPGNKTVF